MSMLAAKINKQIWKKCPAQKKIEKSKKRKIEKKFCFKILKNFKKSSIETTKFLYFTGAKFSIKSPILCRLNIISIHKKSIKIYVKNQVF